VSEVADVPVAVPANPATSPPIAQACPSAPPLTLMNFSSDWA
jgi:hypothetical protein